MNYNLLSLLANSGGFHSGNPGQLPRFQGGQGVNQDLMMLLMSQGMLPKHRAMDGSYILPSAPQPTYGFHSPSAIDAFRAEGPMADRSPYFHPNWQPVNTYQGPPTKIPQYTPADPAYEATSQEMPQIGKVQGPQPPMPQGPPPLLPPPVMGPPGQMGGRRPIVERMPTKPYQQMFPDWFKRR